MQDGLHADITHEIIGSGFAVFNELGPGLDESDYRKSMVEELNARELRVKPEAALVLTHRGKKVDEFRVIWWLRTRS